jgi:hypothetical protein
LFSGGVLILIFLFNHRFFYVHGGYLLDSGWNAFICFRNGLLPVWPQAVKAMEFGSYGYSDIFYQYHASPIISLFSLASYVQPLNLLNWFSFLQAAWLVLITYSTCSLADWFLGDSDRRSKVVVGGVLGLVFAFNGFVISCLAYPHLEMPLLAFGLCFLVSLLRGRHVLAAVCFVLACGAREDAGFHLCALLFMLWIAAHVEPHLLPFKHRFLLFTVLGFFASVLLLALQKLFFPIPAGIPSALQYSFFGPEGSMISWNIIRERLAALSVSGLVLVVPVAVTVVVAATTRKWVLLLGWLAYVPWFLLNLAATDHARQVFGTYHGFPFVFAVVWPLLVLRPPVPSLRPHIQILGWVSLFILGISSAVGLQRSSPGMFRAFWSDLADVRYQSVQPFDVLRESLRAQPERYGRLGLDDSFGCIYIDQLVVRQIIHRGEHYDTLMFFKNTMFTASMIRLILENGLTHGYELKGTNALIVSNREFTPTEQPWLKPVDVWLPLASFRPSFARRDAQGAIAQKKTRPGVLAYGPHYPLPAGKYRITFKVEYVESPSRAESADQPVARLEVCHTAGSVLMATDQLSGADLPVVRSLTFDVTAAEAGKPLEFRVIGLTDQRLRLTGLSLEPL